MALGSLQMRREPDYFEETELDLIYMASRLRDALKLEKLLTDAGIDYVVETGTYVGGLLIKRDLTGAYFYVAPDKVASAREVLLNNRFKPYEPK
jgi:hypothetical protein